MQLGYIKDNDDDFIDYFNSLPPACKLKAVEDLDLIINMMDDEEAKVLKEISQSLKLKARAKQPSVLYDEDMDERKCGEVERI